MTCLDTHVAVWLLKGARDLPQRAQSRIETDDEILISPMVLLDIQNLYEIGRLRAAPEKIFDILSATIGLRVSVRSHYCRARTLSRRRVNER